MNDLMTNEEFNFLQQVIMEQQGNDNLNHIDFSNEDFNDLDIL